MRKKLFLLMLSVICTQLLIGQDFYCKMPILAKRPAPIEAFFDANNNSCFVIQDFGKLYFTYIIDSTKEISSTIINCPSGRELTLYGVQSDADHFYFYYHNKKDKNNILLYTIIKTNISQSYRTVVELPIVKKDKYVASYAYDEHFYIVYFNKKKDKVAVITFDEWTKAKRIELEADPDINQLRFKTFFKEGKFTNVYPNEEMELGNSALVEKVYFSSNNQLVFISDKQKRSHSVKSRTSIALLDLAQKKIKYHEIVFPSLLTSTKSINSYLYKDVLFKMVSTHNFLNLEIYNLEDASLKKKYQYRKPDTIDLLSEGHIYRGGNLKLYPKAKEIESWSKFYKELDNGYPFISVQSTTDSLFRVRMGALQYGSVGGGMVAGNSPTGPTFYATPSTQIKSIFNHTYFESFLSTSDFNITETPDLVEKQRKIHQLIKELYKKDNPLKKGKRRKRSDQPTIVTYQMNSNTILFGYFDKKPRALKLYTF